jgi:hypothetical protein
LWKAFKIGITSAPTSYSFTLNANGAVNGYSFYAPVYFRIPSSIMTDNEFFDWADNFRSYTTVCTVGQLCDFVGPVPQGATCAMNGGTTCTATVVNATKCIATSQSTGTVIAGNAA